MRVSLVIDGDAVPFDPEYPEEFERAAGSQFVERKDGVAWVRTQGGVVMAVYEGWAAVRPGGGADRSGVLHHAGDPRRREGAGRRLVRNVGPPA